MKMLANIQHFLDEDGEVPDLPLEAKQLLDFLTSIVESASLAYDQPITMTPATCRQIEKKRPCSGEIEAWVDADSNEIGWACLECDAAGKITHWEGTRWDKREYTRH